MSALRRAWQEALAKRAYRAECNVQASHEVGVSDGDEWDAYDLLEAWGTRRWGSKRWWP